MRLVKSLPSEVPCGQSSRVLTGRREPSKKYPDLASFPARNKSQAMIPVQPTSILVHMSGARTLSEGLATAGWSSQFGKCTRYFMSSGLSAPTRPHGLSLQIGNEAPLCLGLWYREVFGASLPGARDTSGRVVAPRLLCVGLLGGLHTSLQTLQGFPRPVWAESLIQAGLTSQRPLPPLGSLAPAACRL